MNAISGVSLSASWKSRLLGEGKPTDDEGALVAIAVDQERAPENPKEIANCRSLADGRLPLRLDLVLLLVGEPNAIVFLERWQAPEAAEEGGVVAFHYDAERCSSSPQDRLAISFRHGWCRRTEGKVTHCPIRPERLEERERVLQRFRALGFGLDICPCVLRDRPASGAIGARTATAWNGSFDVLDVVLLLQVFLIVEACLARWAGIVKCVHLAELVTLSKSQKGSVNWTRSGEWSGRPARE